MIDEAISLEELESKVIGPGLCVACGACVGHCPYLEFKDGKVLVMDRCKLSGGRCVSVCPQYQRQGSKDGDGVGEEECGEYALARSRWERALLVSQYGGVVSTLITFLLRQGRISSGVLTGKGNNGSPSGVLVRSEDGVLECAGSRYTASASLSALNQAIASGEKRVGVVGLPCQMTALTLMEKAPGFGADEIVKIGLFCTWAMEFRGFREILREEGMLGFRALKYDIPPPPANVFVLYGEDGSHEIPLERMRKVIQRGCLYCPDMTAVEADVSVGAAEGITGYNTLIIRTQKGRAIVEACQEAGLLELREMPSENLAHLKEAAMNKRKRAKARIMERVSDGHR